MKKNKFRLAIKHKFWYSFLFGAIVLTGMSVFLTLNNQKSADPNYPTYYIREKGGTANQCDGSRDEDFPGSTTGKCAWNNPMIALPSSGSSPIGRGGNLYIGSGKYDITSPLKVPSGFEQNEDGVKKIYYTVIKGKQVDDGESLNTILNGKNVVVAESGVLDLSNTNYVDISWLDITDSVGCGEDVNPLNDAFKCKNNDGHSQNGIYADTSSNVVLSHINVHGMGRIGFLTKKLNNWVVDNIQIIGNFNGGWDFKQENTGDVTINNSRVEWNGCVETTNKDSNGNYIIKACDGSKNADGIASSVPSDTNFTLDNVLISHNTSDGLDFLYLKSGKSHVTLNRVYAENNRGNQVKTNANATITNSVIVGNCLFFQYFKSLAVDNYYGDDDGCRTTDGPLAISHAGYYSGQPPERTILKNNTIFYPPGDVLVSLYNTSNSGSPCEASSPSFFIASNNIFYAGPGKKVLDSNYVDNYYCPCYPVFQENNHNLYYGIPNNFVINNDASANNISADPRFKNMASPTNPIGYDLSLNEGSPAIDIISGSAPTDYPADDYLGNVRPWSVRDNAQGGNADIGAYEFGSTGGAPFIGDLSDAEVIVGENLHLEPYVTNADQFYWEKIAGPGVATFENQNVKNTNFNAGAVGTYEIKLTATKIATNPTDNKVTSKSFNISVISADTTPRVTLVTNPPSSATAPATIHLSISNVVLAPSRTISNVEFFNGETLLTSIAQGGTDSSYDWTGVPVGTYQLKAKVTDSAGETGSSSVVTINVIAPGTIVISPLEPIKGYPKKDIIVSPTVSGNVNKYTWSISFESHTDGLTLINSITKDTTIRVENIDNFGTYKIKLKAENTDTKVSAEKEFIIKIHKTADINDSGKVDSEDFFVLLSSWGTPENNPKYNPMADISSGKDDNSKNKVDSSDFFSLLEKWG